MIPAAVAAIAVIVAFSLWWFRKPDLPEGFAAGNGRLEATEVDIATKSAGRLSEVAVREGDLVQREQIVARMDVRELEADLRQAQAEFQEAVHANSANKAKLVQQECAADFAALEFQRSDSLVKKRLIPQQEADLARSRRDSERAAVNAARASVTQSDAAIAAAQAKIDAIQAELDDSVLKSPLTSRVLYRLAEPGEVLPEGGKVLTLIDLTDVYMTVFLPTAQAGKVRVGAEARIVLDAAPDMPLPAQVSFVSPEAQFTPKQVETESEREKLMFRIKARVDAKWLSQRARTIVTGVPGMLYVRLDPEAPWPERLQPTVDARKEAVSWFTPLSRAN